jgi:hypothetical protein
MSLPQGWEKYLTFTRGRAFAAEVDPRAKPGAPAAVEWLLEENNPSVRYFTLRDLLDRSELSIEVQNAKKEIMTKGIVPKILSSQNAEGTWAEKDKFYRAKYKGTVWQLIILANLGADGNDPRIKTACEFLFHHSQDKESGGFSYDYSITADGGSHSGVVPCLTGNMVWSLIRLGYLADERLRRAVNYIAACQRYDDGERANLTGWPYDRFKMCYGKHTCHMGAGKALKALAEIPSAERSPEVRRTIDQGVEYFLKHHIYKKSRNLTKVSKPGWLNFGFPLMYQDDVLEMIEILAKLKVKDKRLESAIELVESKKSKEGKWILENTFNGRFFVNIEQKGKPSKWITLKALQVLEFYRG